MTKLIFALVAIALTVSVGRASSVIAQSTPLRVGLSPIDVSSDGAYAADMGFYAKAGLPDVTLEYLGQSAAVLEAVVSGGIDIGYGAMTIAETAIARGLPIVAIAPTGIYNEGYGRNAYIMLRNGIAFHSPKDFEGKTIASTPLRSIGELAMDRWIDSNGGDSSKVHYVEIALPAVAEALHSGRIDGASLTVPWASVASRYARTVGPDPLGSVAKKFLIGAYFTTRSYAAAHPDVIRRFAAAIAQANDWANKHPNESAEIQSKYTKIPIDAIKAGSRSVFGNPQTLTPEWIQPTIDLVARYKLIGAAYKADSVIFTPPK